MKIITRPIKDSYISKDIIYTLILLKSLFKKFFNKASQIQSDPILRSWLIGRLLGRWQGEPAYTAHHPSYLSDLLPLSPESPTKQFCCLKTDTPTVELQLKLPCESIILHPGDENKLFTLPFRDIETKLAIHRFAWLSEFSEDVPVNWVAAIWQAWIKKYSTVDNSWAWHPYTVAERAVNILSFIKRYGLPGSKENTLSVLTAHAHAIVNKLEYFGDHHTSNHLANNGRGLYLLGLTLGLKQTANIGGRILIEEAKRIFHSSGVLREGSSHYHMLLTRNFEEVANAAEKYNRKEASSLRSTANKARTAAKLIILPGGLPLVGDISPDVSPNLLLKQLGLNKTNHHPSTEDLDLFREAGWYRKDFGPFSALWHASPKGWSQMPGHGHQDIGSFELHYGDEPVFVDPGRGHYGDTGDAALYRSASVHNTLIIDGSDPYPPNKPYYCDNFRRLHGGPNPCVGLSNNSLELIHSGYQRFTGVKNVNRKWTFNSNCMSIVDTVSGQGKHKIERILITPLKLERDGNHVILHSADNCYRLISDSEPTISTFQIWKSYGSSYLGRAIIFSREESLPWTGKLSFEKVQ